jgi:hypothetical protein
MTLNINNTAKSSVNPFFTKMQKDPAANKLLNSMEGNENIDFDIVEDTTKDEKLTTLQLVGDNIKDMKVKVRVNVDDIERKAKEKGIDKDVFLSQHIASVMSASHLMLDAIKDGKDPNKYLSNAEFLVATSLMADGVLRRTLGKEDPNSKKDDEVRAYLDQERAKLPERIKAEQGEIATGGGDALEVAEALGFVGINTGGWADKIVKKIGDLPDLETLEETTEAEAEDDADDTTVSDSDTDTAETTDTDTETATKDAETNWWHLLLAGGAGFLAGKFLFNGKKADERETQLALQQQQAEFQLILAQQQAQQKATLLQTDYQAKLATYQAQVAAANTAPVATMPIYPQGLPLTYAPSATFSSVPNLASYPLPTVASSVQLPAPSSNDWV